MNVRSLIPVRARAVVESNVQDQAFSVAGTRKESQTLTVDSSNPTALAHKTNLHVLTKGITRVFTIPFWRAATQHLRALEGSCRINTSRNKSISDILAALASSGDFILKMIVDWSYRLQTYRCPDCDGDCMRSPRIGWQDEILSWFGWYPWRCMQCRTHSYKHHRL